MELPLGQQAKQDNRRHGNQLAHSGQSLNDAAIFGGKDVHQQHEGHDADAKSLLLPTAHGQKHIGICGESDGLGRDRGRVRNDSLHPAQ
jgi:hypothetical protein